MFNESSRKKAIAYYRHSAEDKQENSVPIQRGHAEEFAKKYNIEIIHEEADEGKTGLLADRPGFEKLFNDWILNDDAPDFDYVLVYDVSRWGRFQDQDEAAYYEFRCKQRGKKVVYISRGFPKEEEQLISHLQTSIERYMAAEYSRQLSDKVFYGCVKVSEQGYSAGGTACYGMTRLLLDENKKPIKKLKQGEWKSLSNERITFTPKNDKTTKTVQEIFRLLVEEWKTPKEISSILNKQGIKSPGGTRWNAEKIRHILTNETYTGARIYNKTWGRLRQKTRTNPRNEWVIKPDAFPAIVGKKLFAEAQEHLYWLMPSKWKKGVYLTRKAKNLIQKEVQNILEGRGIHEEDILQVIEEFPSTFAVTFFYEGVAHWCFRISEQTRNSDFVMGIGMYLDQGIQSAKLFYISTNDFDLSNNLVFSEADASEQSYLIDQSKLREKLEEILDKRFTDVSKTKTHLV